MNNDLTSEECRMIATELDHRSRQIEYENPELSMRYHVLADRFAEGARAGLVLLPRQRVAGRGRRKVGP